MGNWCLHASSFIFDQIIRKVAGNQDRHKSSVEFDFGPDQTTHFGVICPWVTKISHFWTWISLKPVGQSWSNFMCSIIGMRERLHKVLGQIDIGTLDSGERSLPFGLLVLKTVWCINIIIWDYESAWPNIWPQNKCRSLWPIFQGPVILPFILKTVWCMNIIIWDYESAWPDIWPHNKCRSLWSIFHVPMILPYISKTIW